MIKKIIDGEFLAARYDALLAPYAVKNAESLGREYSEPVDGNRLPFQRDRDRVIHTTAFRRLRGKTQVVRPAKGDHYRNRLSHTIEVAQMARDLARTLYLNEDLAEALALAHDLGHAPFGHKGEEMLNIKMKPFGSSFEHNEQSLRIVQYFESRYPAFPGLNLSREVLEGLRKHDTKFINPQGQQIYSPHLESQLVDIADSITYLSADVEDSIRGGFVALNDFLSLPVVKMATQDLSETEKNDRPSLIRSLFRLFWKQLVADTKANIETIGIATLEDVQKYSGGRIVAFNPEFYAEFLQLKRFLFERYYYSPEVVETAERGQKILSDVFDYLLEHPEAIPVKPISDQDRMERRVCDYIAGMTDHFLERFWEEKGLDL